ncbi:MAG: CRISPR-associated endonuclease Cas2 [Thermoproteus sp.]
MAMYIIVVYDISENDVRTKVAEVLRAYGLERVQRSVFVGRLPPALVKDLAERIGRTIRGANADVAIFKVDRRAIDTAVWIGARPQRGDVHLH